jgi:tetratricopeptide (TPR) repeat protein
MVAQFPTNAEWLYKQGVFYAESEKFEAWAVFKFEKVLWLDSSYSARAYLLTRIGELQQLKFPQTPLANVQKPIENLQKALYIKLDTLPGLYALLGKSAMLNQQPASAIEAYQKEYTLSPDDEDLAYTIARLYARNGQKTEALEWLRRALDSGFRNELVLKYDREWDGFRGSDAWKALWKAWFPDRVKD